MLSGVFRAVVSAALLIASVASCAPPPTEPDVVVFQWVQAFAAQDGTTVARLTCKANQADNQNARLLTLALGVPPPFTGAGGGGGGQFIGGGGGGQAQYDVSNLRFETTFADERNARVQVTGVVRLTSGMASQSLRTNSSVPLTREQDQWRVCDSSS
jgi:hypothetical protein